MGSNYPSSPITEWTAFSEAGSRRHWVTPVSRGLARKRPTNVLPIRSESWEPPLRLLRHAQLKVVTHSPAHVRPKLGQVSRPP